MNSASATLDFTLEINYDRDLYLGSAAVDADAVIVTDGNGNSYQTSISTGDLTGSKLSVVIPSANLVEGETYSVEVKDRALKGSSDVETPTLSQASAFTVPDVTPPSVPPAPVFDASSDLGISDTDDLTSDDTPTFSGLCLCILCLILWRVW